MSRCLRRTAGILLASTAIALLAQAGAALAQAPAAASGQATETTGGNGLLGEVVVTATRQNDTVNRVPLSITAVTQKTLDQQGIKKIDDLARTVPGVQLTRAANTGDLTINIRGISSPVGTPTTGVYIDDVPITKRSFINNFQVGLNGPPVPQMFDLDRVEVLRGPQGTLFGGSSEGGNIRFITPTPSLTRYSEYARAEASTTEHGDPSYELGVAVGGPIIQDKLGFRASIWGRHTGGYIDHVDLYTAQTLASDTNWADSRIARFSVLWQPIEGLQITPALLLTYDHSNDTDVQWSDIPQFLVKGGTLSNTGVRNGVPYSFPSVAFPSYVDGPYNQYGDYTTGTNYDPTTTGAGSRATLAPRTARLTLPSLTVDYDAGKINIHNSFAYIGDRSNGYQEGRVSYSTVVSNAELTTQITGDCGQAAGFFNPMGGCQPIRLVGFPQTYQEFTTYNRRHGIVEELRLSSKPGDGPLSWVAGFYYSSQVTHAVQRAFANTEAAAQFFHGIYEPYLTGVRSIGPDGQFSLSDAQQHETETAVYGQADYLVTSKLKATAGVRVSREELQFYQENGGQVTGAPPGFVGSAADPFPDNLAACPTSTAGYAAAQANPGSGCPFVFTSASTTESPVTPKFGLSYQATPDQLYYVTAAKGFRPGGVNAPVSAIVCAVDFAALGITSTPQQYSSDSLWSYEAGAKVRLFNRAQINASLFYIDWTNVQTNARLINCGRTYTVNAGGAISKGFDVQYQWRVVGGFNLSGSIAYDDAYYNTTLTGIGGGSNPPKIITAGEPVAGVPLWQYTVTAQYNWDVAPATPAYVRFDYQWREHFESGSAPTDSGYNNVTRTQPSIGYATARAGVTVHGADVSVFVNNLFDNADPQNLSCCNVPIRTYTTFRPREFGVQVAVRR